MKRAIEGRMLVVIMLLAVALAAQLQGVWGQTTGTDIEIGEGSNTCKVPFGEPCPDGQPGVRCFRDPCDNSFAKCPGHPDALCGSFYCQSPVMYRGQSIGRGCQCAPAPYIARALSAYIQHICAGSSHAHTVIGYLVLELRL